MSNLDWMLWTMEHCCNVTTWNFHESSDTPSKNNNNKKEEKKEKDKSDRIRRKKRKTKEISNVGLGNKEACYVKLNGERGMSIDQ